MPCHQLFNNLPLSGGQALGQRFPCLALMVACGAHLCRAVGGSKGGGGHGGVGEGGAGDGWDIEGPANQLRGLNSLGLTQTPWPTVRRGGGGREDGDDGVVVLIRH